MANWTIPIFDRTLADAYAAENDQSNSATLKGALNAQDLNRIEQNTIYLRDILQGYNYPVEIITHAPWVMFDLFYLTDMDRIRQNVINLMEGFYKFSSSPIITLGNDYLSVTDINDVEKALFDVKTLLDNMVAEFRYCGTIYAGGYFE